MKNIFPAILTTFLLLVSCSNGGEQADAFGNFEATEVTVSAETAGRILEFPFSEGTEVRQGQVLVVTDTNLMFLQLSEIDAAIRGIRTRLASIEAQNAVVRQQIENLDVNIRRTENLLRDDAATVRQMDDLKGQHAVLGKQIDANNTQKNSVESEIQVYLAKRATLMEQIARARVKSPVSGTLIGKYSEAGELTSPGRPLAKIADLSTMKLRVFVSGSMLASIRTGDECTIRIDSGKKEYRTYSGIITNISAKAEFTPKMIQTKEERVTLVYAVDIEVKNDGSIKSGMPGEAIFKDEQGS